MSNIYNDNADSIGKTPLVRINHITQGAKATVLAKIEGRNPAYSVKCRIGANMIWDAEKTGKLKPGMEIVEPTSGNTGIALAFVAAAKGYKLTLTMPETMSIERRRVLAAFGATLVLTPGPEGMKGAIKRAEEIAASEPTSISCPSSSRTRPTRPSTKRPPARKSGTTPTAPLTCWSPAWARAAPSPACPASSRNRRASRSCPWPWSRARARSSRRSWPARTEARPPQNPGHRRRLHPRHARPGVVDRVEQVSSEEAVEMARRLGKEEGILVGISCGAAMHVANKLAHSDEFAGKTIVVVLPDAGERYLSTVLFQGVGV
jgi:cysteine synthase A